MDDTDKDYLYDLIETTNSNEVKFASYLLLDNKEFATKFFNKMTHDAQTFYQKMPIYHFINNDAW